MDHVPLLAEPQEKERPHEKEEAFLRSEEYIVNTKLYFLRDVLRRDGATRVVYAKTQEKLPEKYVCDIEWHDPELGPVFHNLKTVTWHHNNEESFLDKCLGKLFVSTAFCKVLGASALHMDDIWSKMSFPKGHKALPQLLSHTFDEDKRAKFRLLQCLHFDTIKKYEWFDIMIPASFENIQSVAMLTADFTHGKKFFQSGHIAGTGLPRSLRALLLQIILKKKDAWCLVEKNFAQKHVTTASKAWFFPSAGEVVSSWVDNWVLNYPEADLAPSQPSQVDNDVFHGQTSEYYGLDSPPYIYEEHLQPSYEQQPYYEQPPHELQAEEEDELQDEESWHDKLLSTLREEEDETGQEADDHVGW